MWAFRVCRASHPSYDGEGARLFGGRWNSRGTKVLYMSESRALAVLDVLVHLTKTLPDKYVIGSAEIPGDLVADVSDVEFGDNWQTPVSEEQAPTRRIGDEWARSRRSAVLRVPSVVVFETNLILNPEHPDFSRIRFTDPQPFRFDVRLLRSAVAERRGIRGIQSN
jgi:RES domain-containing protein